MMRRPPRSTQSRSSAASDVYKRQASCSFFSATISAPLAPPVAAARAAPPILATSLARAAEAFSATLAAVSYTHLRAHVTVLDLACRLLLEKKNLLCHSLLPISVPPSLLSFA
eukprot:TRINITY_DN30801_c0_g1_i1.p1 TRINITY_DN30801_c0_g1~~TRINITY_DN30801_c0_g1_i1.p1  ORF type:complete len:113 (+),score=42.32 TRINITY_DN30801_c0_g1_i1:50-388(+)